MNDDTIDSQLVQNALDEYAERAAPQYIQHATKFQELDRWTGDDPVMLIVDAAFSSTGLNYKEAVKPAAERFQQQFVEEGAASTLADLRSLRNDPDYTEQFGTGRPDLVWRIAETLLKHGDDGADDLSILQSWAENADPLDTDDPIRDLHGIGLATFQYLRMIAGADTVKPDIQVERFIEEIDETYSDLSLDTGDKEAVLESCQRLAENSDYSLIEIDQIAWWVGTDTESIEGAH